MKIYNILILVSRFNGDLYLKQHSTKYLNIANLIKKILNLFSFELKILFNSYFILINKMKKKIIKISISFFSFNHIIKIIL